MSLNLIPLLDRPQKFSIQIGAITYQFNIVWRGTDDLGGWTLDITQADGTPLIAGQALITNVDLMEQYQHLVAFNLYCATQDGNNPTFAGIGTYTQLFYAVAS